jgi:SAM-dependent methyltransferase
VVTSRLAAHHFADAAGAFREIARILQAGGLFVLVDNYAPDDPGLGRFINEVETLRDPSHVRNHTVAGWRELVERAGLRTTVDSDTALTKLTTENWLERSQTSPERATEVRRRLRDAPPDAIEAFQITPTTFAVHKLILIGRK